MPEVTLTGVKQNIEVLLQNISDRMYKATYTPTNPGAYLLNVMWSDRYKIFVSKICVLVEKFLLIMVIFQTSQRLST